jgi:hypothetical protein
VWALLAIVGGCRRGHRPRHRPAPAISLRAVGPLRVAGHAGRPEIHARTGFPSRAGASAFAAPLPALCQSPRASEVVHECCME